MKKTNLVLMAVLGVAGVAAGCGGGEGGMAFTEDEYCNQRAAAECGALAPSCAFSPVNEAACKVTRKKACATEAAALKSPPKRVFREARGKACVSASRNAFQSVVPAASWQTLRETCSRTFEGLAKANEVCTISLDCESGMICDKGVCGKSKVVLKDAGCANAGEVCSAGQFCTKAGEIYKCVNRMAVDQACSEPGNLCSETLRCVAGVCKERLAVSETCTADANCKLELVCDPFQGKCSPNVNLAQQCSVLGGGAASPSPDAAAAPDAATGN